MVLLRFASDYCACSAAQFDTRCGLLVTMIPHWLWHLPASRSSVVDDAWGVWTYKRRGKDKPLIAELKVKQTLKRN
jgi:hypothetical protein